MALLLARSGSRAILQPTDRSEVTISTLMPYIILDIHRVNANADARPSAIP